MESEFDPAKDAENIAKHGLSLDEFVGFDETPTLRFQMRGGELRRFAIGRVKGIPHSLVYVMRDGKMRLISFRRAREKEIRRYDRS